MTSKRIDDQEIIFDYPKEEKQEQQIYTIKEVAEVVGVTDHTLRKWEDDYKLIIPRNEMNHRYYTLNELDLFKRIVHWKENGFNKDAIKKLLEKSVDAIEQRGKALELMPLSNLDGKDIKTMMAGIVEQLSISIAADMEEKLERKLEEKFQEQKEQLTEKIRAEVRNENEKLVNYIENARKEDKKGFFSKLFGRK